MLPEVVAILPKCSTCSCNLGKKNNNDPAINDKIKIVFMENYGVSLAEIIIPAAGSGTLLSSKEVRYEVNEILITGQVAKLLPKSYMQNTMSGEHFGQHCAKVLSVLIHNFDITRGRPERQPTAARTLWRQVRIMPTSGNRRIVL